MSYGAIGVPDDNPPPARGIFVVALVLGAIVVAIIWLALVVVMIGLILKAAIENPEG